MRGLEYHAEDVYERMSQKDKDECREIMWRELNKKGIFTVEQLDEAIAKQPPLMIMKSTKINDGSAS